MKKISALLAIAQVALMDLLRVALSPIVSYAESRLVFRAIPDNYPEVQQFLKHMAIDPNSMEMIIQPLYDWAVYPAAGTREITFFQAGIGQGKSSSPNNGGNVKTKQDTNLQGVGGQLPRPQIWWIDGIDVMFDAGSVATADTWFPRTPGTFAAAAALPSTGDQDVNAIVSSGSLTLNIAEKKYYQEAPLYMMPPTASVGIDAAAGVTDTNTATADVLVYTKARAVGMLNKINPGIGLQHSVNFNVQLEWAALLPTPSTNNGRIGVKMRGFQLRAVQ